MLWYLGRGAVWFGLSIWKHRWGLARTLSLGFWRLVTLASVAYLVYDRIYESDATLSVSASDPNFAFEFPFTITNNSHVFAIRNVKWSCHILSIKFEKGNVGTEWETIRGASNVIAAGQNLNIDCALCPIGT